jgi:hypothetical protein
MDKYGTKRLTNIKKSSSITTGFFQSLPLPSSQTAVLGICG